MSVYGFFSYSFLLSLLVAVGIIALFSCGAVISSGLQTVNGNIFMFDNLSFYLVLLVLMLGCFSVILLGSWLSSSTTIMLMLSLGFSGLCFCVNHSILFWCLYELSMLPLLLLIFKDSPYSERFLAGWYFAVYLLVTSLPLLLIIIYLTFINGSTSFMDWSTNNTNTAILVVLCLIFFTKVPLSPFHTWLPIVHAEATSIVSMFLSGYIMKLGLLGVYRCSPSLFTSEALPYLIYCCVLSVFFIVTASSELDGKRWLAFLSLSHIVVAFISFFIASWEEISLSFIYCLGHGLSAGLVFSVLWLGYNIASSRNWLLVKESLGGGHMRVVMVLSLLSLCSFPPTLQFFCEVNLITLSTDSWIILSFWCLYLFMGGLVPLTLCGHLLIRSESQENGIYDTNGFNVLFLLLLLWCYFGIFLL
uniref:NADH-ubiquinone oxidoreductase chain 4 n=1 Tax=Rhinebothrium sp. LRP 10407 TaxID=2899471 RepID=A0A8K1SWI8_9CEST|nr:NADH dehydrogenase subunit 4 [Rhinebothrium sp. LRP 10407]